MSSEYREPLPDSNENKRQTSSELWGPWGSSDEDTTPVVPSQHNAVDPQFSPREHVTGSLAVPPSEAPLFQPAYVPYPSQGQGYPPPGPAYPPQGPAYSPQVPVYPPQGYPPYPAYQGYPGYPGYRSYPPAYAPYPYPGYPPYSWQPQRPKRDGYLLSIAIITLVGSSLALLAGLGSAFLTLLIAIVPHGQLTDSQYFAGLMTFVAFTGAFTLAGAFGLYHSIRSLLKKPSANFALPMFWIFILLYLVVVIIGFALHSSAQEVAFPTLTAFLISLAALFPAVALVALGVRRLRNKLAWPTSWRRFAVALASGATLGIGLALAFELGLLILLVRGQGAVNLQTCINNPNATGCQNPSLYGLLVIVAVVIAPLVEETVKPVAVGLFIGRVRSAAEAFVLGLACGIGFDLVETVGYISSGYHDWLNVALERTGTGLLHGFGAAMVALGLYYLTHAKKRRFLLAFACWLYAVLQHAIWNGTATLVLLPAPVGPLINSWNLDLGFAKLPFIDIVNIFETLLFLAFFIYITGKLKLKTPPPSSEERSAQPLGVPQVARQAR